VLTRLVQMLEPPSLHQTGGFRDGRFNGAIQIFIGSTLVAMATKIRPFSTHICHNSACTNAKAAEFTANRGFLGTAELLLPFKFFLGRPLLLWLQKLGYFRKNGP